MLAAPQPVSICHGISRRELLRVGGSAMLGLSLGSMLELRSAAAAQSKGGGPGWGKARSIIFLFLQGGPSHLDLWDPKENLPDTMKGPFQTIPTKLPGVCFTEILPQLANVTDKVTLIRSMSYTPVGLFNHTAAMYQMHTGYTTDKVSPSGQLEPPDPKDFPNFGSNIIRLKPPTEPMPPFGKLNRWWRENGLPDILGAYLTMVRPATVVDLLSLEYRESVAGYANHLSGIEVKRIDFPGMGRASQPRRGETVAEILRTGKA